MTGQKILIVEDNGLNLELATDLLEANGFVVYSAGTAEEGLKKAEELLPELVLMDFNLPGMDGLSATKALKTNPKTRHLRVVGLTANAMKGAEEAALNAGCDGYVTKPIDTRTFVPIVSRLIGAPKRDQGARKSEGDTTRRMKSAPELPKRERGFVLVVDDEEQNRALLRGPLEARGYEVEEAENGVEALKKVAERMPDAILLDLMMPRMDGFEVCRALKANSKTGPIPILLVTALSERKERLMGIACGANDFLHKPIDLQDLLLRVGNAVHTKHLHDLLQVEKEISEQLLLNIFPRSIAERMKKGETNIAESYADVTVLLADLVGFTNLAAHITPEQMVQLLNEVFSAFDVITEEHGLEKVKTIGDGYMVVGGTSSTREDHAEACALLAVNMQGEIERLNEQYNTSIRVRIGICSGPIVAGVIGRDRFAYDIWGETVNLACQLESTCEPGKIQISESTQQKLLGKHPFQLEQRMDAEGPGEVPVYWLSVRMGDSGRLEDRAVA